MDIVGKKIFEIGGKYYFEDLGLRHTIHGYRPNDMEKILENIVFEHLLFCGYDVKTGQIGDLEIDFVCERRGEKQYVQVTYLLHDKKTVEREFGNMLKIKDNYPKVVVSMDEFSGNTYEGIEHMHLRKFLTSLHFLTW